jgi:hypothetical protein
MNKELTHAELIEGQNKRWDEYVMRLAKEEDRLRKIADEEYIAFQKIEDEIEIMETNLYAVKKQLVEGQNKRWDEYVMRLAKEEDSLQKMADEEYIALQKIEDEIEIMETNLYAVKKQEQEKQS